MPKTVSNQDTWSNELETIRIAKRSIDGAEENKLRLPRNYFKARGEVISLVDTLDIPDCNLYFTNSRIHESQGDILNRVYSIKRFAIPDYRI